MASVADRRLFWGTAAAILVTDILSKLLAEAVLSRRPVELVGDWVQLRLVYNPCAAFGICLGDYSRWIYLVLALGAMILLHSMARHTPGAERVKLCVLALIFGGAAGNVVDRVRSSVGVVDFVDVGIGSLRWPTFNVADSAITVGAILLFFMLLREGRSEQRPKEAGTAAP